MTTFNAKDNLANFGRSLGNGATMGALFCDGVLHAIETKNTNHIAAMFSKAKAKEDMQAMRVIKSTVIALYSGNEVAAKIIDPADENKPIVIKTKGTAVNQDMVRAMKILVADDKSMRGKIWGDTFKPAKDDTAIDYEKIIAALVKKEGFVMDDFIQTLATKTPTIAFVPASNIAEAA